MMLKIHKHINHAVRFKVFAPDIKNSKKKKKSFEMFITQITPIQMSNLLLLFFILVFLKERFNSKSRFLLEK